jgi:hypothetical protein
MEATSRLAIITGSSIIFAVLGASLADQTGRPAAGGAAVGMLGGLALAVAALREPDRVVQHASTSGDLYDPDVDGLRPLGIPRCERPARAIERKWLHTRDFPAADEEGQIQMIREWTQFITSTAPDGNRRTRPNLKRYETVTGINLIARGNGEYRAQSTRLVLRESGSESA